MNPKLVTCLFASMVLGVAGAGAVLATGGGVLAALAAYSLGGSVSLVPLTVVAFRDPVPDARPAGAKPSPAYS